MKVKNVLVAIFALAVLLGTSTSSANAVAETWPSCGEKVVTTSGEDFLHQNFKFENEYDSNYPSNPYFFNFTSYKGWKIYEIYMEFGPGSPVQQGTFPSGRTSYTTWSAEPASKVRVTLEKDCDYTPGCKSTDNYVFTLLGNYPCNLISGDKTIPERFLNPNYTTALCNLPDRQFEWNGKWVKNNIKICDGYDFGGQYYDTRFGLQYDIPR